MEPPGKSIKNKFMQYFIYGYEERIFTNIATILDNIETNRDVTLMLNSAK